MTGVQTCALPIYYLSADGRSIDFTDTSAVWPVLTSATVAFTTGSFSKVGSIVTPTGANKKVRVELTTADTTSLTQGTGAFKMVATLTGGSIVTLVSGNIVVKG